MPAKSKAQQHFMGMVHAVKQGKLPRGKASKAVREAADSMTDDEAKDYVETKTDGLPERKEQDKEAWVAACESDPGLYGRTCGWQRGNPGRVQPGDYGEVDIDAALAKSAASREALWQDLRKEAFGEYGAPGTPPRDAVARILAEVNSQPSRLRQALPGILEAIGQGPEPTALRRSMPGMLAALGHEPGASTEAVQAPSRIPMGMLAAGLLGVPLAAGSALAIAQARRKKKPKEEEVQKAAHVEKEAAGGQGSIEHMQLNIRELLEAARRKGRNTFREPRVAFSEPAVKLSPKTALGFLAAALAGTAVTAGAYSFSPRARAERKARKAENEVAKAWTAEWARRRGLTREQQLRELVPKGHPFDEHLEQQIRELSTPPYTYDPQRSGVVFKQAGTEVFMTPQTAMRYYMRDGGRTPAFREAVTTLMSDLRQA